MTQSRQIPRYSHTQCRPKVGEGCSAQNLGLSERKFTVTVCEQHHGADREGWGGGSDHPPPENDKAKLL